MTFHPASREECEQYLKQTLLLMDLEMKESMMTDGDEQARKNTDANQVENSGSAPKPKR